MTQSAEPAKSATSPRSAAPTPAPPPSPGPQDPGATDESVKRKLLMGVALLLALASIYAGVFNVGQLAQVTLAAGATIAVVMALTSSSRRNS